MSRRKTNCCLIPKVLVPKEAKLYQKIRTLHCDRKRESHRCRGKVTIDAKGMTLSCPVCGDCRAVYDDRSLGEPNGTSHEVSEAQPDEHHSCAGDRA